MAKTIQKLPDNVIEVLPALFQTYPKLNQSTPSSWIVWKNDGEVKQRYSAICHASMATDGPGWDELITAVPQSNSISLGYQRMLINGPFRAFSDLISLSKSEDFYYLHCSKLDKWPANVLFNYCIATRLPIEWNHYLPLFNELVEKGFDQTLAFLLSYATRGKGETEWNFPFHGHMWLDAASDWTRVLSGDMTKLSTSFKERPQGCRPCNAIWGHSEAHNEFRGKTFEEVAEFFNVPIAKKVVLPIQKSRTKGLYAKLAMQDFIGEAAVEAAIAEQLAQQNGFVHQQAVEVALPNAAQQAINLILQQNMAAQAQPMAFEQNANGWEAIPQPLGNVLHANEPINEPEDDQPDWPDLDDIEFDGDLD